MRIAILLLTGAALSACVSAETRLVAGRFAVPVDPAGGFCENYAQQTYWNAYEDNVDLGDGFGARGFARANAERAADRAYERCLAGRLN